MYSENAIKALDIINRSDLDNGAWGLVTDSNKSYFVPNRDYELSGTWLYVYVPKGWDGPDWPDFDQFIYEDDLILLYKF